MQWIASISSRASAGRVVRPGARPLDCAPYLPAPLPMADSPAKPWFVYLVRAANGALYCGISDDPQRRFAQHQSGRGARFFHSSPAVALVYVEACADRSEALRRERAIKALRKPAKEALLSRSEEHTSELQSRENLVCRL